MNRLLVMLCICVCSPAIAFADEDEFRLNCRLTSLINTTTAEANWSLNLPLEVKVTFHDGDKGMIADSVGNTWEAKRTKDEILAERHYDILGHQNQELISVDRYTGRVRLWKWEEDDRTKTWMYEGTCKKLDTQLF